jgi:short-subunit dehydrogenase
VKKVKVYALITGGSSGIGLSFARELASEGWNLVLASNDKNLASAAADLRKEFDVKVETLTVDLSTKTDLAKVEHRLKSKEKPVEILVNSAGFVLHDSLVDGDLTRQTAAFSVMAEAVLILSQTAAATMTRRGRGRIINIASTSAWLYAGNYSALKRWVVVYTQSLALELRDTGISAVAICPGETKTNFHRHGGLKRPSIPSWLWCRPEQIARLGLRAAESGKTIYVPTIRWRIMAFSCQYFQCLAKLISRKLIAGRVKEMRQRRGQN